MDSRLVAWARSVKARQQKQPQKNGRQLPPLWLFTDSGRVPDPCPTAASLPRGLCGVVLRHDDDPDRVALGRRLARICRARRLCLVVAADWRRPGSWRLAAALGAGLHLRGGRRPTAPHRCRVLTCSAHDTVELIRARRADVALVFLSPAFATASHPGAAALGPVRWSALARAAVGSWDGMAVAALGGIDGRSIRALAGCAAAGSIEALTGNTQS